jgi:hypothetical protein
LQKQHHIGAALLLKHLEDYQKNLEMRAHSQCVHNIFKLDTWTLKSTRKIRNLRHIKTSLRQDIFGANSKLR